MRAWLGVWAACSMLGCGGGDAIELAGFAQACEAPHDSALRFGDGDPICGTGSGAYTNRSIEARVVIPPAVGRPASIGISFTFEVSGLGPFDLDASSVRDGRELVGGAMEPTMHLVGELVEVDGGVAITATFSGTTYFRDRPDVAQARQEYAGAMHRVMLTTLEPSTAVSQCYVPTAPSTANAAFLFEEAATAYCSTLVPSWSGDALSVDGDFFFGPSSLGYEHITVEATASESASHVSLPATITVTGDDGTCTGSGTWTVTNLVRPPSGDGIGQIDTSRIEGGLDAPCSRSFDSMLQQMQLQYTR